MAFCSATYFFPPQSLSMDSKERVTNPPAAPAMAGADSGDRLLPEIPPTQSTLRLPSPAPAPTGHVKRFRKTETRRRRSRSVGRKVEK